MSFPYTDRVFDGENFSQEDEIALRLLLPFDTDLGENNEAAADAFLHLRNRKIMRSTRGSENRKIYIDHVTVDDVTCMAACAVYGWMTRNDMDVEEDSDEYWKFLEYAIRLDNVQTFEALLSGRSVDDVDGQRDDLPRFVHIAALSNSLSMLKYLIEVKHCDPGVVGGFGDVDYDPDDESSNSTALHYAASCGYLEIVRYLVETHNMDPKVRNSFDSNCLHRALANVSLTFELLHYLVVNCHMDMTERTSNGATYLHFCRGYESARYFCIHFPWMVTATTNEGSSPLSYALANGENGVVAVLVRYGATVPLTEQHITDESAIRASVRPGFSGVCMYSITYYPGKCRYRFDCGLTREQKISFVMGKHARLGQNSPVRRLPGEVISMIFNLVPRWTRSRPLKPPLYRRLCVMKDADLVHDRWNDDNGGADDDDDNPWYTIAADTAVAVPVAMS